MQLNLFNQTYSFTLNTDYTHSYKLLYYIDLNEMEIGTLLRCIWIILFTSPVSDYIINYNIFIYY